MARFRTILVATDGTDASDAAVDAALDLAHETGGRLLVLAVVPEGVPLEADDSMLHGGDDARLYSGTDPSRGARPDEDDGYAVATERAQAIVDHAAEWEIEAAPSIWEGEPGEAIIAAAEAEGADLIVMGTHGRGGVGRMLLGSVSDHVIRNATVPVMVVRPIREEARQR